MSAIHQHHHNGPFPRGALVMAGILVGGALLAATAVRTGFMPVEASPTAVRAAKAMIPVQSRSLIFVDGSDRSVQITDATTGKPAATIAPFSESGFVRGVMRQLMRERKTKGVAENVPFTLAAWPDGSLSLTDTGTGRDLELGAFGSTNRAAFAAMLK